MKAIISGGGTGGHIFPALSIAGALRKADPECGILFVGAKGRMEMEKVPAAGYRIIGLPVAGFQRRLALSNLKLPFLLASSMMKARKIIRDFRPDIVIGVGGYASVPMLKAAQRAGVPTIIQEQNSVAGLSNRMLGKKAAKICVAYEGMEKYFPQEHIVMTGNPIREGICKASAEQHEEGIRHFGLDPGKKCLLVVGGSLGCRTLNDAMMQWIAEGGDKTDGIQVIWQYGKYYGQQVASFLSGADIGANVKASEFIGRMDMAYAAADLVVSRAGAGTISELCAAAKATVFVPSPNVTDNHQYHNAEALCRKDAALLVEDRDARQQLMPLVLKTLHDDAKIRMLEDNISALAMDDAADRIVRVILDVTAGRETGKK